MVPRGTKLWAMRFMPEMAAAAGTCFKTETRCLMREGNCEVRHGAWPGLQLETGRPDGLTPHGGMRARYCSPGGTYRTVAVESGIRAGDLIWMKRPGIRRATAAEVLIVSQTEATRLQDISEAEAIAEGIEIFGISVEPSAPVARIRLAGPARFHKPYRVLLGRLSSSALQRWIRTDLHATAALQGPTARDVFALLWETINGRGSWASNPWVWRYRFTFIPDTPDHLLRARQAFERR